MLLVYKGVKKNPWTVEIKGERIKFVSGEQVKVPALIGNILLKNAFDVFERVEEDPPVKTRGKSMSKNKR